MKYSYPLLGTLSIAEKQQLLFNGRPENHGKDHLPIVKFIMPETGWSYLITELDEEFPSIAYALCDSCEGSPMMGFIDLEDMSSVEWSSIVQRLERVYSFKAHYPISIYASAALDIGAITDSKAILDLHFSVTEP